MRGDPISGFLSPAPFSTLLASSFVYETSEKVLQLNFNLFIDVFHK